DLGAAVAVPVGGGDAHGPQERRVRGERGEAGQRRRVHAAEDGGGRLVDERCRRRSDRAAAADHVGAAVTVDVASADEDAATEIQVEGEVALHHLRLAGDELVDGDVGPAAGAGPGDDVGAAVTGHVSGGDAHAAREGNVVREVADQRHAVLAGQDEDVGAAAGVGADDDVGVAVAVGVAGRHVAAAGEVHVEGEEVVNLAPVLAGKDDHVRSAAGAGGADDVRVAVGVHVADRDPHAAGELRVKGEEA